MAKILFLYFFVTFQLCAKAQLPNSIQNKWGFIGNGIIFFTESDNQAYVELMEQDNYSFIDLYTKGESKNKQYKDKISVTDTTNFYSFQAIMQLFTNFGRKMDTVGFCKEKNKKNILYLVGKNRINAKRTGLVSNLNCDTTNLKCPIYIYDLAKLNSVKKLKRIDNITKTDFTKFLNLLKLQLLKSCNTCNYNFLPSIVNDIMIQIGYNPISSYETQYSTSYKTSALYQLNFELLTKYKELKPTYEKMINNFYFNKQ